MAELDNLLFSEQELEDMKDGLFSSPEEKGPVTVLGKTFANDEDRRLFYRDELRKKLPELRTIAGFPVGSDDDIINLSDPPYYTACPNPWLNDLIKEWNSKKNILIGKGLRTIDCNVAEPYASDVSEGKNNPVYTAHTYHTKVPHPAIMRYILHYTEPGDIVFDGFAGTGMTGVAAQACGNPTGEQKERINAEWEKLFQSKPKWGQRHAICGDLSPYASMISYNYNTPLNRRRFELEVKRIFDQVKEECKWMYTTLHNGKPALINYVVWSDIYTCDNCGSEFVYWDTAIDTVNKCMRDVFPCPHCNATVNKKNLKKALKTEIDEITGETYSAVKSVPVIVVYTTEDGKRFERKPTAYDLEVIEKINNTPIPYWYPSDKMMGVGENWGSTWRAGVHTGVTRVSHFYTRRNLIALATFNAKVEGSAMPSKLRFLLTGMISRSCKMNRVHVNNYFNGGGGWNAGHLKGTMYIPSAPVETSILEQMEDKLSGMLRAQPLLPKEYDNGLYVASAENTSINDDSIDYIFVDPPFGANIMYSELNFLPEAWLKVTTENSTEAIENPGQNKSAMFYLEEMQKCFREFYRILRPGKWMTVEFSNTSSAVWNAIQRAITSAGFVIANVSSLDKKQGGMRSITTSTAVRQDLAISCYKPSEAVQGLSAQDDFNSNVWLFVEEHLKHLPIAIVQEKSTAAVVERSARIIYDRLISYFVERSLPVPIDSRAFQVGLKERYLERDGMFFTSAQAAEYDEKRRLAPNFISLGLIVSNEADGIEWLRNKLQNKPQTYQDIQPDWMQAINGLRKNDILPELSVLLEENFIQEEDGKWRIPNIQDDVDKAYLRTKALLREFKMYVEQASKPKAKIKEVRVEAVRAGFKQCYIEKDFQTIVTVGNKIPQNLLEEDEILLQFYDIAVNHV